MGAAFGELAGHDAYELLGVEPSASHPEVKRAYRERAKANHPDLSSSEADKTAAEERIRLLNAAYEILENRRAEYDAFRAAAVEEPAEEIIDDPWDQARPGTADAWAGAAETGGSRAMPPPPAYHQAPRAASVRWGPHEHEQGLVAAGELFRHVIGGGELGPLPGSPVILPPGERAFADLSLEYSRFYGMDVTYRRRSVAPSGSAAFVLGALAANAVGNAVARNQRAGAGRSAMAGTPDRRRPADEPAAVRRHPGRPAVVLVQRDRRVPARARRVRLGTGLPRRRADDAARAGRALAVGGDGAPAVPGAGTAPDSRIRGDGRVVGCTMRCQGRDAWIHRFR